jgi:myo-inositol 2-dehydrogenase / D-chiro-inositol 1-dehydrogenase
VAIGDRYRGSMTGPLRIGLLGVGAMGAIHARNVARAPGAVLVMVGDADVARAEHIGGPLNAAVCADPAELIASVDAVLIAATDTTHADLLFMCIAAGRPVLCEKPLAMTVDDARAVVEAERAHGRALIQLGFMREFDPAHVAVRTEVQSGRLGRPVLFRGTHVNPDVSPFRMTDEEAVVKSMIHDIHSTRFLTGCEFTEVHARSVAADDDARFTRYVAVSAQLTHNAIALLDVNMHATYGYEVTAEVVCSAGTARTALPVAAHIAVSGERATAVPMHWGNRFAEAYRVEVDAWVTSVRQGRVDGPTSADGVAAQQVADACCRSLRSGRPEAVAD